MLAVNNPDIPVPALPHGGRLYSELNLTAKRITAHWGLHGGPIGHLAQRLTRLGFRTSIKRTGVQLQSPEELRFNPELLDRAAGRLTRGLLRWLDFESIARRRRVNYAWLAARLEGTGVVLLQPELPAGSVPLFLPILVKDKFPTVARLEGAGIEAIPVWGIHHSYLRRGQFPGTEFLVDHAVEIPIFQDLNERHLERIAQAVIQCARWPDDVPEEYSADSFAGDLITGDVAAARS
jgi:hypothetical protein